MVIVEILAPIYDEESGQVEWRKRALVKADGGELNICGDEELLGDETMTVVEPSSRRKIDRTDDPEGWARNLPHAFRAGDLVAVVRAGDSAEPPAETDPPRDLPIVPKPPASQAIRTSVTDCI